MNAPSIGAGKATYQQVNLVPLRKASSPSSPLPSSQDSYQNHVVEEKVNKQDTSPEAIAPIPKSNRCEASTEEGCISTNEKEDAIDDFLLTEKDKPIVVVNLERLCGYMPKKGTERDAVKDQVYEVFSNDDEFEERIIELFEMNMARHADTSNSFTVDELGEIAVYYPEFLYSNDGRALSTQRLWKKLNQNHKIEVVQRILCHLRNCDKSLVWKSDMQDELFSLTDRELEAKQNLELDQWRSEGRKQQLDKLYQVRETFSYRLEMAQIHLDELEDLREKQVQQKCCGLQALDLQSQLFAVDEKVDATALLGMQERIMLEDEQFDHNNSDCSEAGDSSRESRCKDGSNSDCSEVGDISEESSGKDGGHDIKENQVTEAQQLLVTSEEREEKEKIGKALKEEETIREQLTSEDLRMAYAAVSSLQDRMEQVDDLLESLQDEEWADEEEGFVPSTTPEINCSKEQMTLLDQILAMILGSLSQVDGSVSDEGFFVWIRQEHQEIVESWSKFFGRLPLSTSSPVQEDRRETEKQETLAPSELRAVLGINDVDVDWDEEDTIEKSLTHSSKPGGCLRPGGRLSN